MLILFSGGNYGAPYYYYSPLTSLDYSLSQPPSLGVCRRVLGAPLYHPIGRSVEGPIDVDIPS